jgi:hypothetical protein
MISSKAKQIAFLLTVIAVAFPPFEISQSTGKVVDEMRWMFIGSEVENEGDYARFEKINILVLALEVALIWGGYLVFRNNKSDENDTV